MSEFITKLTEYLTLISNQVPLPIFTFLGALIEEIIAPIPSPLVMTLAGSIASAASQNWIYIILLAITGALGKTLGSYVIYFIGNKFETIVVSKLGFFIGITEKDVEKISAKLNSGNRDDIVLFLLRAIPVIPTAPVSIVCGILKIDLKTYLIATFLGTVVRNLIYLYLGFTSINALESLNSSIGSFEKLGYAIVILITISIFIYIYNQKNKEN